jgi:Fic family protein
MQVVSGRIDRPTVHFEAPAAARIDHEIATFLRWFKAPATEDGLLRSALAHLWFGTIHPYDDGNGRIARAIADMALARDEQTGRRFFSMSRQINSEKRAYYDALERTQRDDLDITEWFAWFLGCYRRSVVAAQQIVNEVLKADAFWRRHRDVAISERQRHVLHRYLQGFEGNLTAKKWATLAKTSVDTAGRDIADLVAKGVLTKNAGGSKNTSYSPAFN